MATEAPIEIWRRSNDPPVVWEFYDPSSQSQVPNLAGYEFEVYVKWVSDLKAGVTAGYVRRDTSDDSLTLDLPSASVSWRPTLEENASIPRVGARYELYGIKDGLRRLWCGGTVLMKGFL